MSKMVYGAKHKACRSESAARGGTAEEDQGSASVGVQGALLLM